MRCRACNVELTDYESTRKDNNGEFYDLCSGCFGEIKVALWEQELTIGDVVQYVPVDTTEEL